MTAVIRLPRRYDPNPDRARAIREAREWAHMSQSDLARALGYRSARPVWMWENVRLDPGPAMVERIAAATRVPVSLLLVPGRRSLALDEHARERRYAA